MKLNRERIGGVVRSDRDGRVLNQAEKSRRGVTPSPDEWQFGHVKSKNLGGDNSSGNLQILSREEDRAKPNQAVNDMKHFLGGKSEIPKANVLKRRLQSLAMLDAVLMPDWELRYFSFNSKWAENTMMASMRDGEGSELFYLFDPAGACGKIYCPGQSEPASLLDQIPKEFGSFLSEPAFNLQQITCCMWQRQTEVYWSLIPGQTKQMPLLAFAGDRGDYYRIWAEQYYERPVSSLGVIAIFNQQPITAELLFSLNEGLSLEGIVADADEIGYPVDQ